MPEEKTYYRPGLVFFSKNLGYQQIIDRDHTYHRYPDGTLEIVKQQKVADFMAPGVGGSFVPADVDEHGRPIARMHEEGVPPIFHDVAGGVFDLDTVAANKNWDEEDKETVARVLLKLVENPAFNDFELAPEPVAPGKPWPKYDDTHHFKIASMAEELGLVDEALAYERFTKNRDGVVKALVEKQGADSESLAAV